MVAFRNDDLFFGIHRNLGQNQLFIVKKSFFILRWPPPPPPVRSHCPPKFSFALKKLRSGYVPAYDAMVEL